MGRTSINAGVWHSSTCNNAFGLESMKSKSSVELKKDIVAHIEKKIISSGEVDLEKECAELSLQYGFSEKTVRSLVATMMKAERVTVKDGVIKFHPCYKREVQLVLEDV